MKTTPIAGLNHPEVILIHSPNNEDKFTPKVTPSLEQYEKDVLQAVTMDLAKRLPASAEDINLVSSNYSEIQVANPCGNLAADNKPGALGAGLAMGYEVVLEASGKLYRYVAIGGLAYYCETM